MSEPTLEEIDRLKLTAAQRRECEREYDAAVDANNGFPINYAGFLEDFKVRVLRQRAVKERPAPQCVPRDVLDRTIEVIAEFVGEQLAALHKRIAELEARPELKHAGTWRETGKGFKAGNLVTHSGSMWLAKRNTKARPGQSEHWLLVVKSGNAT
jgi:hypothetical protein